MLRVKLPGISFIESNLEGKLGKTNLVSRRAWTEDEISRKVTKAVVFEGWDRQRQMTDQKQQWKKMIGEGEAEEPWKRHHSSSVQWLGLCLTLLIDWLMGLLSVQWYVVFFLQFGSNLSEVLALKLYQNTSLLRRFDFTP